MIRKPQALILTGDGINCEIETGLAFERAGFKVTIRHLNDLIAEGVNTSALQSQYGCVALPGGFSFGDDLTSGRVLALKILHGLKWNLLDYAKTGGLVIGICNGFQALLKMQIFGKEVSITQNHGARFIADWVDVTVESDRSIWLRQIKNLKLSIRHGEGRIVLDPSSGLQKMNLLKKNGQDCLRYVGDPNGSHDRIAGLCDETGRIFGLMPHPEAYLRKSQNPAWNSEPTSAFEKGDGQIVFENAYKEALSAR